jgi:hypothetical protein
MPAPARGNPDVLVLLTMLVPAAAVRADHPRAGPPPPRQARRDLIGDDWSLCQAIGTESHDSGDQGVRSFSATGVDQVLIVFPELVGAGLVEVSAVERWEEPGDL